MSELPRILVVDDEPEICKLVERYLGREGFEVRCAGDGAQMRRLMAEAPVDLVVLDVRLPGEDGFTLARELRRETDVGIVMLTTQDDVIDRVAGLESGADDYMPKPFHPRELLARIRSVLRRTRSAGAPPGPAAQGAAGLRFLGWVLDTDSRELRSPAGEEVALSPVEYELLLALASHPRRVLSREFLLDSVRGRRHMPYDRAIDVHVSNLRRKLEPEPARPVLIKTVRGAGYMFNTAVERG